MIELTKQPLFGVLLCLVTYVAGVKIKEKINTPLMNPMLLASLMIIGILYLFKIPLENFMVGGKFISMLLAPATAVLAVSMYDKREIIKNNWLPIVVGCVVGAAVTLASVWGLCKLFGISEEVTMSLMPKSITTAIATQISEEMGGIVPITVAAVCVTGVFGAVMCPYFIKWFRIKNKIAAGLGIGVSCHALGTSKAIEIGEIEGVMSGIAIGLCGLSTVVLMLLAFS